MILCGRCVNPGKAEGFALVCRDPISFFGLIDPKTGRVQHKAHPLYGQCIKNRVLVFPRGKGSTVGSYVIYGLAKNHCAPVAMINQECEIIVATGVILADIPCVDKIDITNIQTDDPLVIDASHGTLTIQ
jgi:predicted aconitase with swiveling domain